MAARPKRRVEGRLVACAVLLLTPAYVGCQGASRQPAFAERYGDGLGTTVPVRIGRYGYPYITVTINGAPVELFLDTGNMSGLFLDSFAAEQLALPVVGQTTALHSDGTSAGTWRLYGIDELEAFGREWSDLEALERPIEGVQGAIGPRFLRHGRFTLDYRAGTLFVTDQPLAPGEGAADEIPLVPVEGLEGMIVVRGRVHGREVLVQVDTGKSRTCIAPELAAAFALPADSRGYRIDDIHIGPNRFAVASAKPVGFQGISRGLDQPIQLGLGADVLRGRALMVDYPRGVMAIRP